MEQQARDGCNHVDDRLPDEPLRFASSMAGMSVSGMPMSGMSVMATGVFALIVGSTWKPSRLSVGAPRAPRTSVLSTDRVSSVAGTDVWSGPGTDS